MGLNINKLYPILFLISFFLSNDLVGKNNPHATYERSVSISFYNEQVQMVYDDGILLDLQLAAEETSITAFYEKMESTPYKFLLRNLGHFKSKFQLNDWLFYELVRTTIAEIYDGKSEMQKELTCWFLLSKAGYNTRLTYLGKYIFVYVHSEEHIFETPMVEENGKTFINISSIHNNIDTKGALLNMYPLAPNPQGKLFSFDLRRLPSFSPVEGSRKLEFTWRKQNYTLDVLFDRNLVDIMENYPIFSETKYLQTPLSATAANSLLPQLQKIIEDKTEQEALELLAVFTRSAFRYKDDKDYFGKNKPMISDEVFHYPYSDCEDRSALFYYLVNELLQLPMIAIAYENHLTIGVATRQPLGDGIWYENKNYYFCDPTGPSNSMEIGKIPNGYEKQSFEILEIKESVGLEPPKFKILKN